MPPLIDYKKCNACGICVDICAQDVFFESENGEKPVVSYPEVCWHCNACVTDCPEKAVRLRIPLTQLVIYK